MIDLLLNERLVRAGFIIVSVLTPLIGAVMIFASRRGSWTPARRRLAPAIFISGPVIGLLWLIYNKVVALFDLDSLAGMGMNFLIFTFVGLGAGLLWRYWVRQQERG